MLASVLTLLLSISQLGLGSSLRDDQVVLTPHPDLQSTHHIVDKAILAALDTHADPVAALISLQPDATATLAEPRLLHVMGQEKPEWMTEGDKLRLRRLGKKFMDITEHEDFYAQQIESSLAGDACESTSSM